MSCRTDLSLELEVHCWLGLVPNLGWGRITCCSSGLLPKDVPLTGGWYILEKELIVWAETVGWAADLRLIFVYELDELWPHLLRDKVARGEVCSFILQYNTLIYIRDLYDLHEKRLWQWTEVLLSGKPGRLDYSQDVTRTVCNFSSETIEYRIG
jgi:hypothetical protein